MDRKEFLKLSALGLLCLPFTSFSSGLSAEKEELYDAIIVGAGLSGLTAARVLARAGKKILVLEAMDRVGGRTWSQKLGNGAFIDIGGQWIGKGHSQMYQLVKEAGLKTFPTFNEGKSILRRNAVNKLFESKTPPLGLSTLLSMRRGIKKFDKATDQILLEAPWRSVNAHLLDRQSLGDWIDETVGNELAKTFFKRTAEGELCRSTYEISMLQALSSAKSSGSFEETGDIADGALKDRIEGGAQGVSQSLYLELKGSVRLNTPVSFVTQKNDYLFVGNENHSVTAKKVIITVPFAMAKRIRFFPELPQEKQALINAMEMGCVIKIHAIYEKPFWREQGLSGYSNTLDEEVELSVDNSVAGSEKGILTSLIHADRAKQLLALPDIERKERVLQAYANLFGHRALSPEFYHDYSFTNNPWIGGAYSGYFNNGVFSKYGEFIAKPHGNIHWAGTETSNLYKGFMEGAVLSGQRVAKEVLLGLN